MAKTVRDYIRTIVDFPHEGILFRDVTTLFADPRGFRMCVDQLLARGLEAAAGHVEVVDGVDAEVDVPEALGQRLRVGDKFLP